MHTKSIRSLGCIGALFAAALLTFTFPQRAAADDNDPPGRVARLGYAHGAVSFQPGGTDEWVGARINRPMTTGDKLWTDARAFAEMNTGSAYIRMGSNTGFSFLNLSDYATQIQLTEGTLLVRLRRLDQNEAFEIDTPNLAFSIYQTGAYEVTVNQTGDVTVVQVRQGEGEVTGGGASYTLQQGDEGRFAGTDGLEVEMSSYRHRSDEFENWSSQRDRRIDHSYSSRYVSPDVIGYEDLDQYGGWRSSGEYGNVWFPHTTEVGWAPYHNGHWAYIAPWGYTWVDDEPWGFAPFHYGRWVNVEGAWGWVPGRRESEYGGGEAYVRPVYAPALVAWVGGPHFAIGISVGGGGYSQGENVGWFPLGPREVYVPSYPVSRTYVNNVNISNTNVTNTVVNNYYNTTVVNNTNNSTNVNVTNVKYVNQTVPGAVTATTPQAFVSAQPVAKNIVQVNQKEIVTAPVRIAAPPVAPSKEAVLGTTVRASIKPPEAVVNRTVVARVAPPAPPVPFVQQQKAIEANGGKPLAGSEIHQMQVKEQQQVQRAPQPQQQQTKSGQPAQAPPQVQQTPQQAIRIAPPAQPQNAHPAPAQAQANVPNQPTAPPNNQQQNNRPANQNTQQQPPQQQQQPANPMGQPATIAPNRPNAANNQTNPNRPNNQPPAARPATPDPALELKHQQELEQLHKQQDLERQRAEQQQQQDRKVQEQKAADQLRLQQQQQTQRNADLQQQQDRKVQEQKAADLQRQQQQQQAQRNADQQQQQDQKVQLQKVADQQRLQQQQQAQRNTDQQQQAQKNADQQRQQQQLQQQQAQRNADQQRQQLDQKHQQDLIQLEQKHAQEQQQLDQKHAQEHQQQAQARPQSPPPPQQRAQQQAPPPPPQKDKAKPKTDRPPQR